MEHHQHKKDIFTKISQKYLLYFRNVNKSQLGISESKFVVKKVIKQLIILADSEMCVFAVSL